MRTLLSITIAAILLLSAACHKNSQATHSCRITGITVVTGTTTATYKLGYTSGGKLASVQYADIYSSYTRNFSYGNNLVVVQTVSTNNVTDSVFLHGNGDVDSVKNYDGSGHFASSSSLVRNSSGQVVQSITRFGSNAPAFTSFTYSNGDVASQIYPTDTLYYSYYPGKATLQGDYLVLLQWLSYGAAYQTMTHLFKSYHSARLTQDVAYTFDGDGKISGLTVNTNSLGAATTQQYQFTYNCN